MAAAVRAGLVPVGAELPARRAEAARAAWHGRPGRSRRGRRRARAGATPTGRWSPGASPGGACRRRLRGGAACADAREQRSARWHQALCAWLGLDEDDDARAGSGRAVRLHRGRHRGGRRPGARSTRAWHGQPLDGDARLGRGAPAARARARAAGRARHAGVLARRSRAAGGDRREAARARRARRAPARRARRLGLPATPAARPGRGGALHRAARARARRRRRRRSHASSRQDLYRIDLSAVVSKYIGETEKNLAAAFDEAERGSAVLFFDEADSLFGKRTEIRDAHDRYANLEVNYLLQRVETFTGLVILATQPAARRIDEAFLRRLRFVIRFEAPDAALRRRLWRRSFPAEAPLGDARLGRARRRPSWPAAASSRRRSPRRIWPRRTAARSPSAHVEHALLREHQKLGKAWAGIANGGCRMSTERPLRLRVEAPAAPEPLAPARGDRRAARGPGRSRRAPRTRSPRAGRRGRAASDRGERRSPWR